MGFSSSPQLVFWIWNALFCPSGWGQPRGVRAHFVHIVSRSIRSRTGYELRGSRVTWTASAWPCCGLPRRPSVYQNHPWCL